MAIRLSSRFSVMALVFAGLSSPSFAEDCTGAGKISKQIAKPMLAAQDAIKSRKWQDALGSVREADAASGFTRSGFDVYMGHEYRGYAYLQLGQRAEAAREYEASLASPCKPENGKVEAHKQLANLYVSLRNHAKTIEHASKALERQRDPELLLLLTEAWYRTHEYKKAQNAIREVLDTYQRQGRTPMESELQLALSICSSTGDTGCQERIYETLVRSYPKPEYWQRLLSSLISGDGKDDVKIHAMRLALAVGVMSRAEQFKEMTVIALDQGLPAEAETIIERAKADNVLREKRDLELMDRLLVQARKDAAKIKLSLAKREMEASASPSGDPLVKLGAVYLSYSQYDPAISALKRASTKSKLSLADEAAMLLGITYKRAGNKMQAAKSFEGVRQDPTMARIAKLWLLNN